MKTPLLIALTAGLSIAASSAAIEIYQGSARNTAQPGTAKKLNYKSTLYVVVDTATGASVVYESLSNSDVQKPAGTLVDANKKFTKVINGAGSFVPAVLGDYTVVNVPADVRDAGVVGTGLGLADGVNSNLWQFVAKKKAAYKAPKAENNIVVGPVLVNRKDGGASLKLNKGLTKDAGATLATGAAAVEALLAKKKVTAL